MLQFVAPPLQIPPRIANRPPARKFNPKKNYFFGSTHIDVGGCAYYRIRFLSQLLEQKHDNCFMIDSRMLHATEHFFSAISAFRLQRACTLQDIPWFRELVMPFKRRFKFRLIYDIDDILVLDDIPKYNCYRMIFKDGRQAVPVYMGGSDVISVTCEKLADYYAGIFRFPREKFAVMPNYLPRFFFDSFDPDRIKARIASLQDRRPRVCFSCSTSHFDIRNVVGGDDDFKDILEWIIRNRKKYQFIFYGGFNPALRPYAQDFKYFPVGSFLDYPRMRRSINADLFIQPLKKNFFNECKSPIKLFESWAEGTPVFVQDIANYKEIAPDACFDSPETLDRMVNDLFDHPDDMFQLIQKNYTRMDGYWLDDHIDDWLDLMLGDK